MVKKLAQPPTRLETGSAIKTPFSPSAGIIGSRIVSGTTIITFRKIEKKIASAVRQNIDRSQKDYFLREQLKAIHTELGDDGKEEDEYRAKILAKKIARGDRGEVPQGA